MAVSKFIRSPIITKFGELTSWKSLAGWKVWSVAFYCLMPTHSGVLMGFGSKKIYWGRWPLLSFQPQRVCLCVSMPVCVCAGVFVPICVFNFSCWEYIHLYYLCNHIKGKNGNNNTNGSWVELIQQYEDPECLSATAQSQARGAAEEDAASVLLRSWLPLSPWRYPGSLPSLSVRRRQALEHSWTRPRPAISFLFFNDLK